MSDASVAPGPVTRIATVGIDWVQIARFITIGCGAVLTLGLVVLSLGVRHIDVPISQDGITINQSFDLGPAIAIVAVIIAGLSLLFAWLTKYLIARVVFLCFDGLAILSVLSQIGADQMGAPQTVWLLSATELLIDLGYGFVLLKSLISPRTGFRA